MKSTPKPTVTVTVTDAEAHTRRADAITESITGFTVTWPDLRLLDGGRRADVHARGVLRRVDALHALFSFLLTPPRCDPGSGPAAARQHQRWTRVRSAFDLLGHVDNGVDPSRLEVDLLAAELARVRSAQRVADALEAAARAFRDDAIASASSLVEVSDKALDLTRSLARSGYHHELAAVLDAMRDIAAPLLRARAQPAEEEEESDKAEAKADSDKG